MICRTSLNWHRYSIVRFSKTVNCWCYIASVLDELVTAKHWYKNTDMGKRNTRKTCPSENSSTISHVKFSFGLNPGPVYLVLAYTLFLIKKITTWNLKNLSTPTKTLVSHRNGVVVSPEWTPHKEKCAKINSDYKSIQGLETKRRPKH